MEDTSTARAQLRAMHAHSKQGNTTTVMEIRQLDMLCNIAFGEGLQRFKPGYFTSGVTCLRPGSLRCAALPPLEQRPMLRLVADREKAGNAAQGYLCSRLRALEVSDPFHILWRIALNGINAAGCKGPGSNHI